MNTKTVIPKTPNVNPDIFHAATVDAGVALALLAIAEAHARRSAARYQAVAS